MYKTFVLTYTWCIDIIFLERFEEKICKTFMPIPTSPFPAFEFTRLCVSSNNAHNNTVRNTFHFLIFDVTSDRKLLVLSLQQWVSYTLQENLAWTTWKIINKWDKGLCAAHSTFFVILLLVMQSCAVVGSAAPCDIKGTVLYLKKNMKVRASKRLPSNYAIKY